MRYLFPLPKPAALFLLLAAPFAPARAQTGGVGIGTTAPDRPLTVQGPAGTTELMTLKQRRGYRDYNSAVIDVVLNYSGPDPSNPTTR